MMNKLKVYLFLSALILTACQDQTVRQDVVESVETVVNESISNNANQGSNSG